ncbi:Probable 3-oxoacyl-(Acyl-carrier-protein) synthase II KasB [Mycobacteroides abscessus subsp. massiliense]|nr:Probable 3-oxoacyl-(Acyl-carrier-protein) synthase II KasB [Mycobacteroides abscessus subsp. massiliense]
MSLREQVIPPTLNFSEPDDVTKGLDVVTKARHHEFDTVLSNSFGFGGMNCTLILAKEA